ncbi:hypothetical protein VNO80_28271 [Phaseolus coccineus]|uniref:Uncharacterized protein n=1 Tax=Phaseolus coccineus TaxID=3886 RepID=A0AAN9QDT4_PHACN
MEVLMSPLTLLGGDMQFTRGVRLALLEATREVIWVVPSSDLLRGGLEMLCHSVVMIQLGCQEREHHAEEISRLDHELAETSGHLKQSLAANSDLSKRLDSEAEMARVLVENTQLKRMVEERDEKLSSSTTELATLQASKDKAEAELDNNFNQTEELLRQSFLHAGRIMPIAEMKALVRQQAGLTEGKEDEDHED